MGKWGHPGQRPHLVRWAIVCLDKRKGGLGGQEPFYAQQGPPLQMELALCE